MATSSITKQFVVTPKGMDRFMEMWKEVNTMEESEVNEKKYEKMHTNSGKVSIVGMGAEIKAARTKQKITMIEAAIYCGVAENTFFRWEHGATRSINEDCYNKLVDILNGDYCA